MKIQTVYLITKHFEASLDFYRKVFDRKESLIMPWGRGEDKVAFFELDNFKFMLSYEEAYHSDQPQKTWLELEHADPDSFISRLKLSGLVPTEPLQTTPAGSLAFSVQDPDGNTVRIGTAWQIPNPASQ